MSNAAGRADIRGSAGADNGAGVGRPDGDADTAGMSAFAGGTRGSLGSVSSGRRVEIVAPDSGTGFGGQARSLVEARHANGTSAGGAWERVDSAGAFTINDAVHRGDISRASGADTTHAAARPSRTSVHVGDAANGATSVGGRGMAVGAHLAEGPSEANFGHGSSAAEPFPVVGNIADPGRVFETCARSTDIGLDAEMPAVALAMQVDTATQTFSPIAAAVAGAHGEDAIVDAPPLVIDGLGGTFCASCGARWPQATSMPSAMKCGDISSLRSSGGTPSEGVVKKTISFAGASQQSMGESAHSEMEEGREDDGECGKGHDGGPFEVKHFASLVVEAHDAHEEERRLEQGEAAKTKRPQPTESERKVIGKWNPSGTFEVIKSEDGSLWFVGIDEDLDEIKGALVESGSWFEGLLLDVEGDPIGRFRMAFEKPGVVAFQLGDPEDDEWGDSVLAFEDNRYNRRRPSTVNIFETGTSRLSQVD